MFDLTMEMLRKKKKSFFVLIIGYKKKYIYMYLTSFRNTMWVWIMIMRIQLWVHVMYNIYCIIYRMLIHIMLDLNMKTVEEMGF